MYYVSVDTYVCLRVQDGGISGGNMKMQELLSTKIF